MSRASPARVALIGFGSAGTFFHAPFIDAVDGLALSVVVTGDPERAARARRDHPGVTVVGRAADVFAAPRDVDLVVVATPPGTHAELASDAIEVGLPVVVDKPLAGSASEAAGLVARAQAAGVPLTCFQNRRWDGDFLTLRRLIDEGALGTVMRFESRFERWQPKPRAGWRQTDVPGAGNLFDLGSHLVDQALLLFGPARSVHAEMATRRAGTATDDDTFVSLEHAGGVWSHLGMSSVAAQPAARFRVLGDRAAYVKHGLDIQEAALFGGGRPREPHWGEEPPERWGTLGVDGGTRPVPTEPGAWQRFYEGMASTLSEGAPVPVDPGDAVRVLTVLEAARTSARERRVVEHPG